MGVQTKGQEGEPYVHRNQLFYKCKPDANKKAKPKLRTFFEKWIAL